MFCVSKKAPEMYVCVHYKCSMIFFVGLPHTALAFDCSFFNISNAYIDNFTHITMIWSIFKTRLKKL